ncbi:MAG: NAD-dependent dehydratase [Candidatus Eremiobacteraeota bacterium]|nr:NAD-dependent dehydratase [Candidatus Eremiobacteraeota bacterium]
MLAYVTGAAGFLGSHLCDRLLREGWAVAGIDNLVTGDARNLDAARRTGRFTLVEADVSLPWTWRDRLPGELSAPRLVLHFASPASPIDYGRLPLETLAVNALGTMHAVALARETGCRLVLASTSECYGDPLEHPQRETYWGNVNPIGLRACYDEAKRYAEAYLTSAVRATGIDGRIVRIFNTYGPRMRLDDGRVIPAFCGAALRGEPLTVFGDGAQTRSFCYVDDLVEGIYRLATLPGLAGRIVNVGNPGEFTVTELAGLVSALLGVPLRIERRPLPPDDPTRRRPDITLARDLLGWEPRVPLDQGLPPTIASFRERLPPA